MNPKNNSVFTIKNENGMEIECEVLFTFDSEETKKSYLVYTDNTKDETGALKVYANIYDPSGNNTNLMPITKEEEWNTVEAILSKLETKGEEHE
ncbi:MAG: DUF1292 domain-containing protein [Bacilli bacterium]|jgi:uncharacterized protein YrzB (UPF0473 family)|nr:DUF1292 domain-containing protein [Bacilli bacterium]